MGAFLLLGLMGIAASALLLDNLSGDEEDTQTPDPDPIPDPDPTPDPEPEPEPEPRDFFDATTLTITNADGSTETFDLDENLVEETLSEDGKIEHQLYEFALSDESVLTYEVEEVPPPYPPYDTLVYDEAYSQNFILELTDADDVLDTRDISIQLTDEDGHEVGKGTYGLDYLDPGDGADRITTDVSTRLIGDEDGMVDQLTIIVDKAGIEDADHVNDTWLDHGVITPHVWQIPFEDEVTVHLSDDLPGHVHKVNVEHSFFYRDETHTVTQQTYARDIIALSDRAEAPADRDFVLDVRTDHLNYDTSYNPDLAYDPVLVIETKYSRGGLYVDVPTFDTPITYTGAVPDTDTVDFDNY